MASLNFITLRYSDSGDAKITKHPAYKDAHPLDRADFMKDVLNWAEDEYQRAVKAHRAHMEKINPTQPEK